MSNGPRNTPVLIVDDDPIFRESVEIVLGLVPGEWRPYHAESVAEASPLLSNQVVEYAIVDVHLPDGTAADVIRAAGAIPCLLCTQDEEELTFRQLFDDPSVSQNIVGYMVKPLQAGAIWSIRAGLQIGHERQMKSRLVAEATARFEEERRLIAQNLHDELGAALTQLTWSFNSIQELIRNASTDQSFCEQITSICTQSKETISSMHGAVSQAVTLLRPEAVSVAGLRFAIEYMVKQWGRNAPNVAFDHMIDPDVEKIDPRRAGIIYRLVQEGITNAMRHTTPARVTVHMTFRKSSLHLSVISHGKVRDIKDTYPLTSLRERTSSLGGVLQFTCNADQEGSCLLMTIPI